MTREKQLKFCSVCKNRKMDMKQGLLCELTNAKADFDIACPKFDEDTAQKVKNERIEQEYQETLTVSGWLAFFLWVGVGLGTFLSCIYLIATLSDVGLTFLSSVIFFFYVAALVATAGLTIRAFYQKAPNAVALARTYIAMIALDACVNVASSIILDDESMLVEALRSFVWSGVWFTYLSCSTHVANMIPKQTRIWKLPEKILLTIYALASVIIIGGVAHFVNNPSDSNFYQKDYLVDAVIEAANEELPDKSDPLATSLELIKEDDKIVYTIQLNTMTMTLDESAAWEVELVDKQEILSSLAIEEDQDLIKVMNIYFDGGYNVCYRFLNASGAFLYDVVITGSEYNNAINAGTNFKCDEQAYRALLDKYTSSLPIEYMGSASLINITHSSTSLSYYVQLPKLNAAALAEINLAYLEKYIQDEWEALDDNLKTLARINKENIVYYFYTAEGEEHGVVTITPDKYSGLE